jgi:Na+/alanine symporter
MSRSALAGAAAGMAGWVITVLSGRVATGQFTPVVTRAALVVPYLAVAVTCTAILVVATRTPRREVVQ